MIIIMMTQKIFKVFPITLRIPSGKKMILMPFSIMKVSPMSLKIYVSTMKVTR